MILGWLSLARHLSYARAHVTLNFVIRMAVSVVDVRALVCSRIMKWGDDRCHEKSTKTYNDCTRRRRVCYIIFKGE